MFDAYYGLGSYDREMILEKGLFIFDTSTILNLYKFHGDTSLEMFKILDSLKKRIWIPYIVGLEYHNNFQKVIDRQIQELDTIQERVDRTKDDLRRILNPLRSIKVRSSSAVYLKLEDFFLQINESLVELKSKRGIEADNDEKVNKIRKLFFSNLEIPNFYENLSAVYEEAEFRRKHKLPPEADISNNEAVVLGSNNVKINLKYADSILWKEILDHCNLNSIEYAILITDDFKSSWWTRNLNGRLTPNVNLVSEALETTTLKALDIMNFSDFYTVISEEMNSPRSRIAEINIKLEQASVLINEEEKTMSAMTIGVALEKFIKFLCEKHEVPLVQHTAKGGEVEKKVNVLNAELYKKEVYNQVYQKSIIAWTNIRNSAAHGKDEEYTLIQVKQMYQGVTSFINEILENH